MTKLTIEELREREKKAVGTSVHSRAYFDFHSYAPRMMEVIEELVVANKDLMEESDMYFVERNEQQTKIDRLEADKAEDYEVFMSQKIKIRGLEGAESETPDPWCDKPEGCLNYGGMEADLNAVLDNIHNAPSLEALRELTKLNYPSGKSDLFKGKNKA